MSIPESRNISQVGKSIRALRKQRGWSAHTLCALTGGHVSYSTLSKLECGHLHDISLSSAKALADELGVTLDDLMDNEVPAEALALAAEIVDVKQKLLNILTATKLEVAS